MPEKTSWEQFFDAHAPIYDDNVFTGNTINEVDFVLEELEVKAGDSVLDVGCAAMDYVYAFGKHIRRWSAPRLATFGWLFAIAAMVVLWISGGLCEVIAIML